MRIGLIDADLIANDGARFPNLALMKIAANNKKLDADVRLVLNEEDAQDRDVLFVSKVFTDTPEPEFLKTVDATIERGGTGYFYDAAPPLDDETEHARPLYEIYAPFVASVVKKKNKRPPWLDNFDRASIGFTTRGCVRGCPFCVNRNKRAVELWSPVEEFDDETKRFIVLLDDNIFAYVDWARVFRSLEATGKPFCFKQGLDVRFMTPEKARYLERVAYKGEIYFSFDNIADAEIIEEKFKIFRRFCPTKNATAYILGGYYETGVDAIDSALNRVEICARYGVKPYVMRYESTRQSELASVWAGLAAWCNQPKQFKKTSYFQTNEKRSLKAVDDARRLLPDRIVKTLETNLWESAAR